jgi:hypothetical protein
MVLLVQQRKNSEFVSVSILYNSVLYNSLVGSDL